MHNAAIHLVVAARLCWSVLIVQASASAEEIVDFERDIEPIFASRCVECHGTDKQESGLRVDRRASLIRGGDSGLPAIMPGDVGKSYLLELVRGSDDAELRMPPQGDPLSASQIELLARWIAEGAHWPGQMAAEDESIVSDHWSLQPLARPVVPVTADRHQSNPIDAFVLRKLRRNRLQPSPQAGWGTLVRRVTLDLTGLPPDPTEAESPANEAAYGHLTERLLASPRYGERWAQHWLDVIRWAETVGFETNRPRPSAWPYRDWVINALNADMPYDRFVFEQLAGDTVGQDAPLGFLVAGPANLPGQIGRDEEAMRQARQDELDEVIRTVSQSLLGLSIGCARCHNHKFDPILQRDYYALQAIFSGLAYGDRRLRGPLDDMWTSRAPQVRRQLTKLRDELESMRQQHRLKRPVEPVHTESFDPISARAVQMRIAATGTNAAASLYELEVWSVSDDGKPARNIALASCGSIPSASSFALVNQTRHFDNLIDGSVDTRQAFPWVAATTGPAWVRVDFAAPQTIDRITWHRGSSTPADYEIQIQPEGATSWITVTNTNARLPRLDDQRASAQIHLPTLTDTDKDKLVQKIAAVRSAEQELARLLAGPQVYAASFSRQPRPTWLLRRGDPMRRGAQIAPGVPLVLGKLGLAVDTSDPQRRLTLARHLTSPNHPLTARVIVNRVWQHHFGMGLVETPSDFGKIGARPSHLELLDWLAVELVENGWSLKHLQRLIVSSHVYRQASAPRAAALRIDADSRLLWRFPPRRLEAETIRDSILSVSGMLNLATGGPGFDFFDQRGGLSDYTAKLEFTEQGWRRMIYAHKIRMQAVDIFGAFDCPDFGQMSPQRTRSITPLQSLSLWNSPFTNRQAGFFAERVRGAAGNQPRAQIRLAFQLALSRLPSTAEQARLLELLSDDGLDQVCRVLFNTSEFISLQ